ncbi:MAG: carboxymuconolactone decarboxylase family protein [Alphaproteobacteria bacterium]|nr:carboxymuconolactone decarboxylase family protein [Alphaproteobacteria bacterium]
MHYKHDMKGLSMTEFTIHTPSTAPKGSEATLSGVTNRLGFTPNIFGVMAESPELFNLYLHIQSEFAKTSLNPTEQQIVSIAVSNLQGCEYCVAAHSTIATGEGIETDVLEALRTNQTIPNKKYEALRQIALAFVKTGGAARSPDMDKAVNGAIAAGYSQKQVLEAIIGLSLKAISNTVNRVAHTPLDTAFKPQEWNKAA